MILKLAPILSLLFILASANFPEYIANKMVERTERNRQVFCQLCLVVAPVVHDRDMIKVGRDTVTDQSPRDLDAFESMVEQLVSGHSLRIYRATFPSAEGSLLPGRRARQIPRIPDTLQ